MRISPDAASAGIAAMAALLNGGTLEFFTGSAPAATGTADSGAKLATCTFGSPAVGSPSNGVVTFNAIGSDSDCDATGTANYWRAKDAEANVIAQGSVGISGADINLDTLLIVQHGALAMDSLTWTQPQV